MKMHRFTLSYFDNGTPKFEAGKEYPVSDETTRLVGQGIAHEVEVPGRGDAPAELPPKGKGKSKDAQ